MVNIVKCSKCSREIDSRGIRNHEAICAGTPRTSRSSRASRQIKRANPIKESPVITSISPIESSSDSKILKVISLKSEYEKMKDVLLPGQKKGKNYECSECGATFDNLRDGIFCPDCGIQLR